MWAIKFIFLSSREYGRRDPSRWPRGTVYAQNVSTTFADKRRSLSRYNSLADSGHGVFFIKFILEIDYRLRITWIMHQQLWEYEVEDILHLGGGGGYANKKGWIHKEHPGFGAVFYIV
jgi:hypothetical protein